MKRSIKFELTVASVLVFIVLLFFSVFFALKWPANNALHQPSYEVQTSLEAFQIKCAQECASALGGGMQDNETQKEAQECFDGCKKVQ